MAGMTREQRIENIKELAKGLTAIDLKLLIAELQPPDFTTCGWYEWIDVSTPGSAYAVMRSKMTDRDKEELTVTTSSPPFRDLTIA